MSRILFAVLAAALIIATATSAASADRPPPDPGRRILERAGWTYIGLSDDVLVYMKKAQPAVGEDGVRRVLTGYETLSPRDRDGFAFRSVQSLSEYDCKAARTRVVAETFFAEPGLKGKTWTMPGFVATPWAEAAQGSIGELRYAFACP
jgi:hypothetical protein